MVGHVLIHCPKILIVLYFQMGASKSFDPVSLGDIEDLIHNFLIIMLEHSMRLKDGWKVDIYPFSFTLFSLIFLLLILAFLGFSF